MEILITNDDGIDSPGIYRLAESLNSLGNITVVAPAKDQSGVGAAITLRTPIRANPVKFPVSSVNAFSVEGTPGDCVILAIERLLKKPPDLVISGINRGANMGLDIFLSGTVGAALQGYFRNIPSIAISIASLKEVCYDAAVQTTNSLTRNIDNYNLPTPFLLNINLPNQTLHNITGITITSLAYRAYLGQIEEEKDGLDTHYLINLNKPNNAPIPEGTDVYAVNNRRISITPIEDLFLAGHHSNNFDCLIDKVSSDLGLDINS